MTKSISDGGRCHWLATVDMPYQREDGWRCGQVSGHGGSHILYSADGDRVLSTFGMWREPDPEGPIGITAEDLVQFFEDNDLAVVTLDGTRYVTHDSYDPDLINDLLSLIKEKTK